MTFSPQAAGRLALLALLGGIIELTTVSQVTIFGVPADLSPLLVASVGFLCGSIPGAVFGFVLGLFIDTALLQTLGVNSLIYTAIGYGHQLVSVIPSLKTVGIRFGNDPSDTIAEKEFQAVQTAVGNYLEGR